MDDNNEIMKYKNARDFADHHGEKKEKEEKSDEEFVRDVLSYLAEEIEYKIEESVDPLGFFHEQGETDPIRLEARKRWAREEETRTEIKDIEFTVMPREKAEGLLPKFSLFGSSWKKFVAEIEAGRVETAEVLLLDSVDVEDAEHTFDREYYCKVADLEGNVLKGCIKKINYTDPGYYPRDLGGWISPYDYEYDAFKFRSEEEYDAYSAIYWARTRAVKVDPEDRKHAYIMHYHFGKNDLYGLITVDEYNDLKKLKDSIGIYNPERCFTTKYGVEPDFSW